MKLKNKVAIITGGGSGIGKTAAILFAQEGAKVAVVDIDKRSSNAVTKTIINKGGEAYAFHADVSLAYSCQSMINEVTKHFGGVDILFNNAGIPMPKTIEQLSEEDWDRTLTINLKSTFLCTKFAIPKIVKKGGGAILNMSSMTAITGSRGQVAYSVSKAGIVSFTKCMALELAHLNIRVNCICPGFTNTPMLKKFFRHWFPNEEEREKIIHSTRAKSVLNRYATPLEIAKAALFLVSDDASFITGQALIVDGGTTINIL